MPSPTNISEPTGADATAHGVERRRVVWSRMLAAASAVVLITSVDVGFERIRSRQFALPHAPDATEAVVPLRNVDRLAGSPVAVILRVRGGREPTRVTVAVDGTTLTDTLVPSERETRLDCSGDLSSSPRHELRISTSHPGVTLLYIEVANVHGYTRGLLALDVVPRGRAPQTLPWWLVVAMTAGVLALRPRPDWPDSRVLRLAHRTAMAIVLLAWAVAVASPYVSDYRLLLPVGTFLVLSAIVYADPLTQVARMLAPPAWNVTRRLLPFVPHAAVVILVVWSVGELYRPKTGFTSLILFGADFESTKLPALREVPHWVERGTGYDGQFYAQLAIDPFLRSHSILTALDSPAYRARRILLPLTAHLIGWGRPWYVLQIYALLNVACWGMLALLLLRWLPPRAGRPTLAWIACLLSEGLLASARQSLPDGPSVLVFALAIWAVERDRRWVGAALLGLAGLTRESNLLGAAVLAPGSVTRRSVVVTGVQAAVAMAPLALWLAYLWSLDLAPNETGLRNFGMPLAGYVAKWSITLADLQQGGWASYARLSLLTLVAITTQAAFLAWRRDWRDPWWRLGAVYALFMTVLGEAVWEGHPGAVGRVLAPMTVAFNVMLPRLPWSSFLPLWVLGNGSVLVGLDAIDVPWVSMR